MAGPTADRWARALNVRTDGNFRDEATGQPSSANILHMTETYESLAEGFGLTPEQLERDWTSVREALFAAREKRIHPLKDDKILTDWNGLMIAALSRGGRLLDDDAYTAAAERAADFILTRMRRSDGGLMHRFRRESVAVAGQADDYAHFVFGLLELYQSTFDSRYLQEAIALQQRMTVDFRDEKDGGFFLTAADATDLPVRPKDLYDGAIPSANAVALMNLLTLFRLTGTPEWKRSAQHLGTAFAGTLKKGPTAFTFFLCALDYAIGMVELNTVPV